mmetsp:Transcript_28410/g.60591  ORF Transcript_28410/g.60591 Transcript_28410/m.60591 type:complete len:203 (+) Transcript_28410:411-1019(+)
MHRRIATSMCLLHQPSSNFSIAANCTASSVILLTGSCCQGVFSLQILAHRFSIARIGGKVLSSSFSCHSLGHGEVQQHHESLETESTLCFPFAEVESEMHVLLPLDFLAIVQVGGRYHFLLLCQGKIFEKPSTGRVVHERIPLIVLYSCVLSKQGLEKRVHLGIVHRVRIDSSIVYIFRMSTRIFRSFSTHWSLLGVLGSGP